MSTSISNKVLEPTGYQILVWKAKYCARDGSYEWRNNLNVPKRDIITSEKYVHMTLLDYDGQIQTSGGPAANAYDAGCRHWIVLEKDIVIRPTEIDTVNAWARAYMRRQKGARILDEMEHMVEYHNRMESVRVDVSYQQKRMSGDKSLVHKYLNTRKVVEGVFDIECYHSEGQAPSADFEYFDSDGRRQLRANGLEFVAVGGGMHVPCMAAVALYAPGSFAPSCKYDDPIALLGNNRPCVTIGEDCIEKMFEWVKRVAQVNGCNRIVLYAHNAKGYDSYITLQNANSFKVKGILRTSQGILSLKFDLGDKVQLEIRCSLVHIGSSLKDACKDFRVPEMFWKKDFDVTQITKDNYRTLVVDGTPLYVYQEWDVWSLLYLFRNLSLAYSEIWGSEYTTRGLSYVFPFLTGVSASRRLFEAKYKTEILEVPRMHTLRSAIRMAMRGGMVQANWREYTVSLYDRIMEADKETRAGFYRMLRQQRVGVWPLDINSLYPFVLQYKMPVGELRYFGQGLVSQVLEDVFSNGYDISNLEFGFVKTRVLNCEACPISVTSYRGKGGGTLQYLRIPSLDAEQYAEQLNLDPEQFCDFEGQPGYFWVSTWDLVIYHMCGIHFATGDAIIWTRMEAVFKDMMLDLYGRRKEAKREKKNAVQLMLKKMMNSLYGAQAMRDICEKEVILDVNGEGVIQKTPESIPEEKIDFDKCMILPNNKQAIVHYTSAVGESYSANSPVQIACAVLAGARFHMFNCIRKAGLEVGLSMPEALSEQGYIDTDSWYVSLKLAEGFAPILSSKLGDIKHDYLDEHESEEAKKDGEPVIGEAIIIDMFAPAPKMRMMTLLCEDGRIIHKAKCKGLNCKDKDGSVEVMRELRREWSVKTMREKWLRDYYRIQVAPQPYEVEAEAMYQPHKHLERRYVDGSVRKVFTPLSSLEMTIQSQEEQMNV